jgi:NADPH-dependent glutamate synthase beta subunit-like oxidoreductase/polyferredoxin
MRKKGQQSDLFMGNNSVQSQQGIRGRRKWYWLRLSVQTVVMLLFLYLTIWSLVSDKETVLPENLFFRFDPLAGMASMLDSHDLIVTMLPGIATLILTLVAGRVWCGWICPLGMVFDWVPSFHNRLSIHRHFRYVKYFFLFAILMGAAMGNLALMWLDPITLINRAITLITPFLVLFIVVMVLNTVQTRFWCRYLCPLGGLLALVSKVPFLGHKKLRFIRHNVDSGKCTACSSVPGKIVEERGEIPPCRAECPGHIDVQAYVRLASKGKFREALEVIKEANPFPSICGRVCHHPCESECNRNDIDGAPVANHSIERFIGDLDLNSGNRYIPEIKEKKDDKVAIFGSGPAGLSCAYFLAREGYQVTIFEKDSRLGGMLINGIPSYRLPRDILEAELQQISDMGVTMKTSVDIGKDVTVGQLREDGFRAFFVAIGTQECLRLGIEGEDLEGVYSGLDFISRVNHREPISLGKRVAVIGGGNTAMDAARLARRLGAEDTSIFYRRSLAEMPSRSEEIEECQEEGISINILTQPTRFIGENGRLTAIECMKMRLTETDDSGRRSPEPVPGSEFTIELDNAISALGQETNWSCLTAECACTVTDWGRMNVDSLTFQSDDEDIFAGGDAKDGPKSVIEAISDGKQAAISIDRFMKGLDLHQSRDIRPKAIKNQRKESYFRIARAQMPRLAPQERVKSYDEVQRGLTQDAIIKESKRCISCASTCARICPMGAIDPQQEFSASYAECITCIDCIGICPNQAISVNNKIEPETQRHHEHGRRWFLASMVLGLAAAVPVKAIAQNEGRKPRITRPPNSSNESLLSLCIRCGECYRTCPEKRLYPVYFEAGIEYFWTPRRVGTCDNYHCRICADACPTGAIS